jgi:hypothetical protein
VIEVYKKASQGHKPLKLEQFTSAIDKLGLEANKQKIDTLNRKMIDLRKQIRDYDKKKKLKQLDDKDKTDQTVE